MRTRSLRCAHICLVNGRASQSQEHAIMLSAARASGRLAMCRLARCHRTTCFTLHTCSTLQTQLDSSPARGTSRVHKLFDQRQVLTLERGIGTHLGKDMKLWGTGSFDVGVYPDLPAIMTWSDFLDFKKLRYSYCYRALESSIPIPMAMASIIVLCLRNGCLCSSMHIRCATPFLANRKTGKPQEVEKMRLESAAGDQEGLVVRTCGVQVLSNCMTHAFVSR